MTEKSFDELFCAQNHIAAERYEREVFNRALYPHARLVAWLIRVVSPEFFAADMDFVRSVASLRQYRDFDFEAQAYAHHPANRGFWRIKGHLRLSSRALRRMVRATLHAAPVEGMKEPLGSEVPFVKPESPTVELRRGTRS